MAEPAVLVSDLVVRFGHGAAAKVAVDGLSLSVATGAVTGILGPNGAGKTTTVETCEGYRRPDAGQVRVLGLDPVRDHAALAPRLGVMLQDGGAWSGVRAAEMLRHVAALYAHPLDVAALAATLGLGSCGRTPYRRLSGGQRRRLALATAIVGRPELAFLDEPTAGLDPQGRHAVWDLVRELRSAGVTVVLTTHDMEEAERLADHVYVVDHGRVVAAGPPAELTARGSTRALRFSGPPGLDLGRLAAALPAGCRVGEDPPGSYRVDGAVDPDVLATVTAWCADLGVMPEGLRLAHATLEDVFLQLTGHELRS